MEISPYLLSFPAVITLLIKLGIYGYARKSGQVNLRTRLYLVMLFAFAVYNIAEISHFFTLANGNKPYFEFHVFYIALLAAIAVFVHLSIAMSFSGLRDHPIWLVPPAVYVLMAVTMLLIIGSDLVVVDIKPVGVSVSRVAGPLYFLFEFFLLGGCTLGLAILFYGARNASTPVMRTRNSTMILAMLPTVIIGFVVLIALRLGIAKFNATIILPITLTFFLVLTAYAIHQHRLFDIQLYIPGTKVRKRKTSFYKRMRNMISEIADLDSAEEVIERVSDTLRCPVALIAGNKPVLAAANAASMATLSKNRLSSIDHIVIASEIQESNPELYRDMDRHGIAAVVPFYPHSEHASGWLLLGRSFANTVYTPLDFQLVEQLFEKMADLFLDKMLTIRTQLAETARALRQSEVQRLQLEQSLVSIETEKFRLVRENQQLISQQPADAVSLSHTIGTAPLSISITALGRDKELLAQLKDQYPQLNTYAGLTSAGFQHNALPEVVIAQVNSLNASTEKRLRTLLQDHGGNTAFLFYGEGITQIRQKLSNLIRGGMIELVEAGAKHERICRRSHALTSLKRYTEAIPYPDYPVISHSRQMRDMLDQLKSHTGFNEPVALVSDEPMRAMSITRHVHDLQDKKASFMAMECCQQPGWLEAVEQKFITCKAGTLLIEMISTSPEHIRKLADLARRYSKVCMVLSVSSEAEYQLGDNITTVRVPVLYRCKDDMPLIIHYYTLQYNMQATYNRYLSQEEASRLMEDKNIRTLSQVRSRIFQMLDNQQDTAEPVLNVKAGDKSLDEQMAEYEATIIRTTLERCGGNKSKAARQLGLKPNTLHYKIERYGIEVKKK